MRPRHHKSFTRVDCWVHVFPLVRHVVALAEQDHIPLCDVPLDCERSVVIQAQDRAVDRNELHLIHIGGPIGLRDGEGLVAGARLLVGQRGVKGAGAEADDVGP